MSAIHNTHAHKDPRKRNAEHALRVSRSTWWTPHGRIKRAIRVEKKLALLRAVAHVGEAMTIGGMLGLPPVDEDKVAAVRDLADKHDSP